MQKKSLRLPIIILCWSIGLIPWTLPMAAQHAAHCEAPLTADDILDLLNRQASVGDLAKNIQHCSLSLQFIFDHVYQEGRKGGPFQQDFREKFIDALRKAAEQDHPAAQLALGGIYIEGRHGTTKDESKGLWFLRQAANQGLAFAQCTMGEIYRRGDIGVTTDPVEAYKWMNLCAARGVTGVMPGSLDRTIKGIVETMTPEQLLDAPPQGGGLECGAWGGFSGSHPFESRIHTNGFPHEAGRE